MLLGRRYLSTTALYTQVATTMIGNTTSPFGRLECRIEATLTIFVGGAAERPGNRAVRGFARRARHGPSQGCVKHARVTGPLSAGRWATFSLPAPTFYSL